MLKAADRHRHHEKLLDRLHIPDLDSSRLSRGSPRGSHHPEDILLGRTMDCLGRLVDLQAAGGYYFGSAQVEVVLQQDESTGGTV